MKTIVEEAAETLINALVTKLREEKLDVKSHIKNIYFVTDNFESKYLIGLSVLLKCSDDKVIASSFCWEYDGFTVEDAMVLCRVYAENVWRAQQ